MHALEAHTSTMLIQKASIGEQYTIPLYNQLKKQLHTHAVKKEKIVQELHGHKHGPRIKIIDVFLVCSIVRQLRIN